MSGTGIKRDIKSLLVTGCCGFIGANFVNHFRKRHPDVFLVNVDILDYCANVKNIEEPETDKYMFVKGDIGNTDLMTSLFALHQFDAVINFAANSHVDNSFGNSLVFTQNNVLGTHSLLEVVRNYHDGNIPARPGANPAQQGHAAGKAKNKLSLFYHISTDEVYGEVRDDRRRGEEDVLYPTNPYSATKAAAEFIVGSYLRSFDLPIIITRGNNVYGPYQFPEKVIPRFVWQLANNVPVTLHGTGEARRTFIHVDDVVTAVEAVLFGGIIGEIYNIGCEDEFSVIAVARKLVRLMKRPDGHAPDTATAAATPDTVPAGGSSAAKVEGDERDDTALDTALYARWINAVEDRAFNDFRYHIDIGKLLDLGWVPQVAFEGPQGLGACVKWYVEKAFDRNEPHWPLSMIPLK